MAFIKNKNGFEVGDFAVTARKVKCMIGCFEKGTKVKVIGISERGYDLQDAKGNKIIETGFDSIKPIKKTM